MDKVRGSFHAGVPVRVCKWRRLVHATCTRRAVRLYFIESNETVGNDSINTYILVYEHMCRSVFIDSNTSETLRRSGVCVCSFLSRAIVERVLVCVCVGRGTIKIYQVFLIKLIRINQD